MWYWVVLEHMFPEGWEHFLRRDAWKQLYWAMSTVRGWPSMLTTAALTGSCPHTLSLFFFQYQKLNSEPCTCYASAVSLELHIQSKKIFYFFAVLRFELMASHLLVRCSKAWATPPVLPPTTAVLTDFWIFANLRVKKRNSPRLNLHFFYHESG
jgi:hypothetical protein